jgi:hypothetical protein
MTATELRLLRDMVAEPTLEKWDDDRLNALAASYPLADGTGTDLFRTAAAVWDTKAAFEATSYNFSQGTAGNATYNRSQLFTQARALARHFRRLAPIHSTELVIDREDEQALKSKWGGYPALLIDPDPTHGGVYAGEFIEEEGDF